jgi:hypothetical protein
MRNFFESLRIPPSLADEYAQKLIALGYDSFKALQEDIPTHDELLKIGRMQGRSFVLI